MIEVKKGDKIVSEYEYDPEGLRVVKKANGETIHYVFEGTEPIYEKNLTTEKVKSYVYAFGKHLARVDGVIGDSNAKKYFYHTDHLGSVKAVTDVSGAKVWDADYEAFGKQYGKNVTDSSFDEWHGFNGKEFDRDIGLYYYNARWYDPELGRFISEDPAMDPNSPNLYSYCANNPLRFTDPTGNYTQAYNDYYQGLSDQNASLNGLNLPDALKVNYINTWQPIYDYYNGLKQQNNPNWKAEYLKNYFDFWGNLPDEFYKNPNLLILALQIMKLGIDAGGQGPSSGWGKALPDGQPGPPNHTDVASRNMVKTIQASLGIAQPTGYYGTVTENLVSLLNSGRQGSRVGQAIINKLINLNQRIANGFNNGLVRLNISNIKSGVIPLMDQFAARRLYILAQRANELKINFTFIDLFRDTPTQRGLYNAWLDGKMPWTNIVAKPGTGPHEAGIAFDVGAAALIEKGLFEDFKSLAVKCGFNWQGPGDKAHFGMSDYMNRSELISNYQAIYNSL